MTKMVLHELFFYGTILVMLTHADIVGGLGIDALAEATGRKPIAVTRWHQRSQIPPKYWLAVVRLAKKKGHHKSYSLETLAAAAERFQ